MHLVDCTIRKPILRCTDLWTSNQHKVSPLQQCSSTPVRLVRRFLGKEQCDHTGASPILSDMAPADFYLFPQLKSASQELVLLWCCCKHYECDSRAVKVLTKWLWAMFPTTLQSLTELYCCTTGLFWRKCSLNYCTLVFLWNKTIPGKIWRWRLVPSGTSRFYL